MIIGMLADLIGPDSLIVIAVVIIVLLFGGSKLPKLARGLGSASHEFKKGMEEGDPTKGDSAKGDSAKGDSAKDDSASLKVDDKTSGPIHPT